MRAILKFIAECDRIKVSLGRTGKIFRSIKAPDPGPGNFASPSGKSG